MPDINFDPIPFTEAAEMIRNKPAVLREVFARLIPEIKARAFTIAGVASADVLQEVRNRIADLPEGADWNKVKKDVLAKISPWLVTAEDSDERAKQEGDARRRAELLLRTHAFQAYQAAHWQALTETKAAFPFWRYVTAGDANVRQSHAALNGLVLPADSPFWRDHFPPWDWGCRCDVVGLAPEDVEQIRAEDANRNPEDRLILDGARLKRLEENGQLYRGPIRLIDPNDPERKRPMLDKNGSPVVLPAKEWNVKAPDPSVEKNAWSWRPGELQIPIQTLKDRYDDHTWGAFVDAMRNSGPIDAGNREIESVWDWLLEPTLREGRKALLDYARATGAEKAIALNYLTAEVFATRVGKTGQVDISDVMANAKKMNAKIILQHNHPGGDTLSPVDLITLVKDREVIIRIEAHTRWHVWAVRLPNNLSDATARRLVAHFDSWRLKLVRGEATAQDWYRELERLNEYGTINFREIIQD